MLGNYSKLIAAVLGNIVGIAAVYLASKGLATCATDAVTGVQSCSIAGMSTESITTTVMVVLNAAFVHWFPANKPSA